MDDTKMKVKSAFRAMEDLDIPAEKVKPVLKKLLKVYDKDWSHIEADNYRALIDAIFESEEEPEAELELPKSSSDTRAAAEPCLEVVNAQNKDGVKEEETEALAHPLKRSRQIYEGQSSTLQTCSNGKTHALLVRSKEEPSELPEPLPHKLNKSSTLQTCSNGEIQALLIRPNEEPGELPKTLPHKLNGPRAIVQSPSDAVVESPASMSLGNRQLEQPKQNISTTALIENSDKAMTEDMSLFDAPLAVLCPEFNSTIASLNAKHGDIDKDCNLSSDWMKKLSLFGICRLLKQLGNKRLEELDLTSLSHYYDIVQDAEKQNFNLKWLRERLDDIRVAIVARQEAKRLEVTKSEHLVERKKMEAKLRLHQMQVKVMEGKLTVKNLEIEGLNEEINNETAKFQHLETLPLLDGLI